MADKLKTKTINGLFWALMDIIGMQGIQFIILLILARILLPEEFGLIAMLSIFIALAQSIIDSGFASALVQKKNPTYVDECSIFYFNIIMGGLTTGLLWISAPFIASFYNAPALIPLTKVLSLNMLIDSFGMIHYTLMKKSVDFKRLTKVSVIASVLSGIIGIIMAYIGFGIWALVAYLVSNKLFRSMLYWIFNSWRPSLIFSFTSLRSMFAYGSNLLFAGILETIFNNLYLLIIGKLFSPADLGFYSRAKSLQQLPVQNISGIVNRVTFPVFSLLQEDKERLKRGMRKALASMAMLTFPMMIGLAIVAKPLVIVLLTSKWLPSVPYLQLLCGVGLTFSLSNLNLNILKAQGYSNLFFKLELFKKILIVISIAVTYHFGIQAMIIGQITVHTLSYFWISYFSGKFINYGILEQLRDIVPSFVLACIMGCGIYLFNFIQIDNQFLLLMLQIISGIILYVVLCHIFELHSFRELFNIVKQKFARY